MPIVLNRERALDELLLLKDELDRLPVDARLDPRNASSFRK